MAEQWRSAVVPVKAPGIAEVRRRYTECAPEPCCGLQP